MTDKAGLDLIANAEGCRTNPYYCSANVLTVGIGSTSKVEQRPYSTKEIADRFIMDVRTAERCVKDYLPTDKMTQGQKNAAPSFVFNLGCGKVKNSTAFKKGRAEDFTAFCNELTRWVYADGKKNKGLIKRREQERNHCLNYK